MVKVEMVFFRTGYNRVPKVLNTVGLYRDWDKESQCFIAKSSDLINKNKALLDLKMKYLKVAEEWEEQGVEWSPIQWSHCFEKKKAISEKEKTASEKVKVLSVSKCFDIIIEDLKNRKRFKNGKTISSANTARNYYYCKYTLADFTQEVYKRSFSTYFFRDIDEQFLLDYALYLQERGAKKATKVGLASGCDNSTAYFTTRIKKDSPIPIHPYSSASSNTIRGIRTQLPKRFPMRLFPK
jgi:hypothetical protein